jgi:hypothetical protein
MITMDGAGLARLRILISLMHKLDLGGQTNSDTIVTRVLPPPCLLGMT